MWDYQKDYVESELRNLTNTVISEPNIVTKHKGLETPIDHWRKMAIQAPV
jgi:hypothetical protein